MHGGIPHQGAHGASHMRVTAFGQGRQRWPQDIIDRAGADASPVGSIQPGDVATRLPPGAQRKLLRLREEVDNQRAAQRDVSDQKNDAITERQAAASRMRQLEAQMVAPDHESMVQAQHNLEAASARIRDLDERTKRLQSQSGRLLANTEQWLRRIPRGVALDEHAGQLAGSPKKGQTLPEAIEAARTQVQELRVELHRVHNAPQHSSVSKAQAERQVDELARRGAPDVLRLVEFGGPLAWPMASNRADIYGHVAMENAPRIAGFAQGQQFDSQAFMAWLFRDQIIEKLHGTIDELASDGDALTDEERAARIANLHAATLAAERLEEALSEAAEAQGTVVQRRPEIDPRAFLGLADDLPGVD
jgi:hypothetical protein